MRGLALAFLLACAFAAPARALRLTSPELVDGDKVAPEQLFSGCGGENIAPELAWSGAPKGTKSYILTLVDLSVLPSQWSHWIAINLPAQTKGLPKGGVLPGGAAGVESNFGGKAYNGPCPPSGTGLHRYQFTLYAMPTRAPAIVDNSSAKDLGEALIKLALAKATLTGVVLAKD